MMRFFRKASNKNNQENQPNSSIEHSSKASSVSDPNKIRIYDTYGREGYINKEEWKNKVLPDTLEKARNNPELLSSILTNALNDGFFKEVIPYAEHLWQIDRDFPRGATILAIVYLKVGRLDDAQRVLDNFISIHGEDGAVLTNLAKVYSRRGDHKRAEEILWHALEIDPNQDNSLLWYAAIHRERGGQSCETEAFKRVAALKGSWRAQLWLAREALERKDKAAAEALYAEALERVGKPVPADLLEQMSGDLGNNGYIEDIIRIVEPWFNPAFHGLEVGYNLIQANIKFNRFDVARRLIAQYYAQRRSDWQKILNDLDTTLIKAEIVKRALTPPGHLSFGLMSIEGPLWIRDKSPFSSLIPIKRTDTKLISIFGSTALSDQIPMLPILQLSDKLGRLSRSIPLFVAEQIHLTTDAIGLTLIPLVQGNGFALLGHLYKDKDLVELARKSEKDPDFVISIIIDATRIIWKLDLRIIRCEDKQRITEITVKLISEDPGPSVERLSKMTLSELIKKADIRLTQIPDWYQIPSGMGTSDYLLRLEQQLGLMSMHQEFLKGGGTSRERAMLDGIIQLCLSQPANLTVRMMFAQTLRQIQMIRPDILSEYKEKINLLLHNLPISGEVAELINKTLARIISL